MADSLQQIHGDYLEHVILDRDSVFEVVCEREVGSGPSFAARAKHVFASAKSTVIPAPFWRQHCSAAIRK
jgi:hypothetical protein